MYPKDQRVDENPLERENMEYEEGELGPFRSEAEWAIKSLKECKSPGCGYIQAETIKASGQEGINVYHKQCNKIGDKWTVAN